MLFSNFTAFSLGNNFHLPSTCTLLFGKKKSSASHCDWLSVLSVISAGTFFGLENYFRGVCSTGLNKGAEQLWFHSHGTGETLGGLQLPFPLPCYIQQNVDSRWLKSIWIQWTAIKILVSLKLEHCFQSLFNLKNFRQSKILGFRITPNLNFSCQQKKLFMFQVKPIHIFDSATRSKATQLIAALITSIATPQLAN